MIVVIIFVAHITILNTSIYDIQIKIRNYEQLNDIKDDQIILLEERVGRLEGTGFSIFREHDASKIE